MRWRVGILILTLLIGGASCSRDPEVVKRKYLENGNKYFERGKYKEASIMYRSALKKDMRYGEAYYRLGLTQLRLNQTAPAAASLRRAVELLPKTHPDRNDATVKLADLYLAAYLSNPNKPKWLFDEINGLAGQLLKENPKSFNGLRLMGHLAWRDGKLKEAITKFQAANAVNPLDPDLVLALVQALAADGQLEESEKLAKALIEKEKSFGPIYNVLYRQYVRQNRLPDAEGILKLKVENNPKQAEYLLQLARYYFLARQREDSERTVQRLLSDPKSFPGGREKVGDFYRQVREFDKAIEVYKGGLSAGGQEKLRLQQKIAETLSAQGKKQEAAKLVADILKENPKDEHASALQGVLLLESGNPKDLDTAFRELQASVSRMPENFIVRFNFGRACWAKGDLQQARTQFTTAVSLRPDYLPPRLALAQIQLLQGEFAKSLQTANEVLGLSPANRQAKLIRALSLRSVGNYDQARKELVALVNSNPGSGDARFQLGVLELTAKNYREAEENFDKCRDSDPADSRCLLALAQTYNQQGHFDRAIQLLDNARRKDPARSEIATALADTAVQARKYDVAVSMYRELLSKSPNSAVLQLKLGETYRRMGNTEPAIEHFRKAKELNPNNASAYIPLAILLDSLGRRTEARTLYEQVLKLQPDNALALNNLAYVIAEDGGDLDQALTYAQRARQKLPQNPNVSDTLGWIYIKKNLSTNAVQIYQELVSEAPNSSTFRYHLGMALLQKGDKLQAKKELEAALRNKPSKEEEDKIRELMEKIG